MHIVPYKHGPVLRRVRGLVDLVGDHLAQPGLLGEPFSCRPSHGMPAQLDGAGLAIDSDLTARDYVGSLAEAKFLGNHKFAFEKIVFSVGVLVVSVQASPARWWGRFTGVYRVGFQATSGLSLGPQLQAFRDRLYAGG